MLLIQWQMNMNNEKLLIFLSVKKGIIPNNMVEQCSNSMDLIDGIFWQIPNVIGPMILLREYDE